ncbi:MAG: hypothetical protein QW247_07715 [Pyrobaculum sp.]
MPRAKVLASLTKTCLKSHFVLILHGVNWLRYVKKTTLKVDKLKVLGRQTRLRDVETVRVTIKSLVK